MDNINIDNFYAGNFSMNQVGSGLYSANYGQAQDSSPFITTSQGYTLELEFGNGYPEERVRVMVVGTYAELTYRALMGSERNRMTLQDIYEGVLANVDKVHKKDWKSAVPNNLSVNKACKHERRKRIDVDACKIGDTRWYQEYFLISKVESEELTGPRLKTVPFVEMG